MNVLFLGNGAAGSWRIRAEETVAQRDNWYCSSTLSQDMADHFDLFVVVKHLKRWFDVLESTGKPVILDVVDGWSQPADTRRVSNLEESLNLFRDKWAFWPFFAGHIFPTKAMQEDLGCLSPCSTVIHHRGMKCRIKPVSRSVNMIGYQGREEFMGEWGDVIRKWCKPHGINFAMNPVSLSELDIGIAVRCELHDSYINRRYKPNIKLANFYMAGLPAVVQEGYEAYRETGCPELVTFSDANSLCAALSDLTYNYDKRLAMSKAFLREAPKYDIANLANEYESFFERVLRSWYATPGGAGFVERRKEKAYG